MKATFISLGAALLLTTTYVVKYELRYPILWQHDALQADSIFFIIVIVFTYLARSAVCRNAELWLTR